MTPDDERLGLLDALIYADAFDCAATLDEVWRFARVPIERDALRVRLREDPALAQIVVERDGLYALNGRSDLIAARPERLRRAQLLQARARRVARVLRHLPFVRGLALTGSTAAGDAGPDADVDMLAIAAPGRLGTTFLLLGPASRLAGRRVFCPNYYVAEDRVELQPGTIYLARELAQITGLTGSSAGLLSRNPWLADVFPNVAAPPEPEPRPSRIQALLEAPLRGALGDRLERWAGRVVTARLRAHYGGLGREVPGDVAESFEAGVALRFHGLQYEEGTLRGYAARRAEIAERLAEIDGG